MSSVNTTEMRNLVTEKRVIIAIILLATGITVQGYLASMGDYYTRYNNFVLFKQSFEHLIHNKNLYIAYPQEYFDLYKYTPTFSLFMALYYYLPNLAGLVIFNVINTAVFIIAIKKLKLPEESYKWAFLFLMLEFGISLIWTQTNILIANLIILAFCFLEEKKLLLASLLIALTVYIKVFGVVAFVLGLLYPQRLRFILYSIHWCFLLAILPLLVVTPHELIQQYQNWLQLIKADYDVSYGVSFIGWMHSWFKLELSKTWTVIIAALIFCMSLLKFERYKSYYYRLQILASLLLWIVIFNRKGESPTYIIAMEGIAIWYFSQKKTTVNKALLWLALIFTSFTSTDLITPGWINDKYVEPFSIKAVFCSVIWFKLTYDILTGKSFRNTSVAATKSDEL